MAWTTPKTWTSEPLVSPDLNAHVRDNLNHLKDRLDNGATSSINEVSDYTTSSTTFVDVDATEGKFQHTITTNGGDVLVGFVGVCQNSSTGSRNACFDVDVDGARVGANGDEGIMTVANVADDRQNVSFTVLVTGLSAGSHVFKLQWLRLTGSGTAITLFAGAGTSLYDLIPQFWVKEL